MKMNHLKAPKKQTQSNPISKNFHAQTQDFFKNPVHKIFEFTFGFATFYCGQDYEKTPKFENKKVDNHPDGC